MAGKNALSDKSLREKAANSDTKMRPAPIAKFYFRSHNKCVSKAKGRLGCWTKKKKELTRAENIF